MPELNKEARPKTKRQIVEENGMSNPVHVSDSTFEKQALESEQPVWSIFGRSGAARAR